MLPALALFLALPQQQGDVPKEPIPPRVDRVDQAMERWIDDLRLTGAGLTLLRDGMPVHVGTYGRFGVDEVVPIASSSKWLTVVTVLTLVDEGRIGLDDEVRTYLPAFDRPGKRAITLRHCLSCTSGLPGHVIGQHDPHLDLEGVVGLISRARMREEPGTALRYGGTGFQVAARVAEVVSGQSWHELFDLRIRKPLGLTKTAFGRLMPPGADAGSTPSPSAGGGAVSTQSEYARFVSMLAACGRWGDQKVLSPELVAQMFTEQTKNLPVAFSPYGSDHSIRYGLGTWIERRDEGGRALEVSDGGAFGWTPWIDLDRGIAGVLAVKDRYKRIYQTFEPVQESIRTDFSTR